MVNGSTALPTVEETVDTVTKGGFDLEAHRRVEQRTCGNLQEFADRTRLRADTALALLSDEEFARGLHAVEEAARQE